MAEGTIDIGATWSDNFDAAQVKHKNTLRILMKTEPIPYDAIVVSQKAGIELANKLSVILNKTSNETKDENVGPHGEAAHARLPSLRLRAKGGEACCV